MFLKLNANTRVKNRFNVFYTSLSITKTNKPMDKLIEEVFDRHEIESITPKHKLRYVGVDYQTLKDAIEEITRIRVAEALIDYHRSTMNEHNLFPGGNFE